MSVSEELRHRLSLWCAQRIPEAERRRRQIGYSVEGAEVTILDRRPPAYPELDAEWTTTPLALLHADDRGRWTLSRPRADGGWAPREVGPDPIALLDRVAQDAGQFPA